MSRDFETDDHSEPSQDSLILSFIVGYREAESEGLFDDGTFRGDEDDLDAYPLLFEALSIFRIHLLAVQHALRSLG